MSTSIANFAGIVATLVLLSATVSGQNESQHAAARDSSVAANYAAADVVFKGFLQNLVAVPEGYKAEFNVDTPVKNVKESKVVVFSAKESRCGHFEEMKAYLVYAQDIGGQLWVDLCNGTKHRSVAEPDLQYIHSINDKVSPECSRKRLERLSKRSEVIALAGVVGTAEETLFSCWSGLVRCIQDERYEVKQVLKGTVQEKNIVVEHVIVDNSLTADVHTPQLSPYLFRPGNQVVLFLWPSASSPYGDAVQRASRGAGFSDADEDCGVLPADSDTIELVNSVIH
jgi:hypothetical protein